MAAESTNKFRDRKKNEADVGGTPQSQYGEKYKKSTNPTQKARENIKLLPHNAANATRGGAKARDQPSMHRR
jgi:hypothetical protein